MKTRMGLGGHLFLFTLPVCLVALGLSFHLLWKQSRGERVLFGLDWMSIFIGIAFAIACTIFLFAWLLATFVSRAPAPRSPWVTLLFGSIHALLLPLLDLLHFEGLGLLYGMYFLEIPLVGLLVFRLGPPRPASVTAKQ
jgi:hypothetical protein